MKKLVLVCGILVSVVSLSIGAMSQEEWDRNYYDCIEVSLGKSLKESKSNKNACQAIIDNGLPSVGQCDKEFCGFVGEVYYFAGRYKEAIPYFEKVIALGDDRGYASLANVYDNLQDYYNAKKCYEIACNKGNGDVFQSEPCYNLGVMYHDGKGVRQDYHKAREFYKKACDMKFAAACNNLGFLYDNGQGVRQNRSTAKQYFGKACDLGNQLGCVNYKEYNERGW